MRRRRLFIVLAICVLVALGVVLLLPGEREPEYNGKSLSYWAKAATGFGKGGDAEMQQAFIAIDHIGTNALPLLVKWLKCDRPTLREKSVALRWRIEERLRISHTRDYIFTPYPLAQVAEIAFRGLETNAAPAIPQLVELMRDPSSSPVTVGAAADSLTWIGDKGVMEVIRFVRDKRQTNRIHAITSIAALGRRKSEPALDVLAECIQDSDEAVAVQTAKVFYMGTSEPEKQVAILMKGMADPRRSVRLASIQSFCYFRSDTPVPELIRALQDADSTIRSAASNTLFYIAPEALTNRMKAF